MNSYRSGAEFQGLMVALKRIEDVNRVAFEAAKASERKPQRLHDRRYLEQQNKLLGRQLRAALLCSAYSLTEAAIIGLAPKVSAPENDVVQQYDLAGKPSKLHFAQYKIQLASALCKGNQWDADWSKLHRLRLLRNTLIHDGVIGEAKRLKHEEDTQNGFLAWIEPMFEGSESPIYVLVVGETRFRNLLQWLQKIIMGIDAELSSLMTRN
ncbi:hypothetical protein [Pararhodobacter oceanensis]|uniref:hypothetical protein n=1 Tax=Pararhodobacter oceanensis TaxID=2172121 RepID=UPI003A951A7D